MGYRMMRFRQRFWAIMDCDEKGRPKTMEPVFFSLKLNEVKAKLAELENPTPQPPTSLRSASLTDGEGENAKETPKNNSLNKKHQKVD